MFSLKQGNRSVAEFAIHFRILVEESDWGETALRGAFKHTLNKPIKDQLAIRECPSDLNQLITLATRIDNRFREQVLEENYFVRDYFDPKNNSLSPPAGPTDLEPMQIGRTRLSPEERQCHINHHECLYRGKKGHELASCPLLLKERAHQ